MNIGYQAGMAFATKVLAAAVSYGFAILLARVMTVADFGQVAFFMTAALLLSVVGAAGQQMAMLRFVPPLLAWGDRDGTLRDFAGAATCRAVTGAIIVATIALAVALTGVMPGLDPTVALIGFALVPAMGWIDIQSHLARSHQHIALSMIPKEILWRGLAAPALLIAWLGGGEALSPAPVLALLLAVLILLGIGQGVALRRLTGLAPVWRLRCPERGAEDWRKATVPFWVGSVSNLFLANADILLVGALIGPAEAGIYFAANRLSQLLAFFVTAQNIVIGPQLSRAFALQDGDALATIIRRSTRAATVPTLVLGAVMWAGAPWLLMMFGAEFAAAEVSLKLLILAAILNAAGGPADIALNMCGHDRAAMRIGAVNLALGGGLIVFGTLQGGVLGTAGAVLAATLLRKAMYWSLARRAMGLRSDVCAPATSLAAA